MARVAAGFGSGTTRMFASVSAGTLSIYGGLLLSKMTDTKTSDRVLAAFEGCYEAPRAAALSGVPVSTVYYWARTGVIVPSVSPERPKRWSYADLIGLRIVYWLRHPKPNESEPVPASPMNDVRRALTGLDHLGLDIWSSSYDGPRTPLRVDRSGKVYVNTGPMVETTHREGVLDETLDLLGPFEADGARGPDLVRPRPHLRIVPGKVSGEPHLNHSRITTQAVSALYDRFRDLDRVVSFYPDVAPEAISEAIDLEHQLQPAA
jgi:uncharacterized protein (DUF433 family)